VYVIWDKKKKIQPKYSKILMKKSLKIGRKVLNSYYLK